MINEFWGNLTKNQKIDRLRLIIKGFVELELFDDNTKLLNKGTYLSTLVNHLQKFATLQK